MGRPEDDDELRAELFHILQKVKYGGGWPDLGVNAIIETFARWNRRTAPPPPPGDFCTACDLYDPTKKCAWHAAPPAAPGVPEACVPCIKCKRCVGACDCTGGPQVEQECTCYEITGGHQPGCAFNRRAATRKLALAGTPRGDE